MRRLELLRIVGSPFCVSNADGIAVHSRIVDEFKRNEIVELSFRGVTRLTTAFLNAAVGQLYDEFAEEKINTLLKVVDADQSHSSKLRTTVSNAKIFFQDRKKDGFILKSTVS